MNPPKFLDVGGAELHLLGKLKTYPSSIPRRFHRAKAIWAYATHEDLIILIRDPSLEYGWKVPLKGYTGWSIPLDYITEYKAHIGYSKIIDEWFKK